MRITEKVEIFGDTWWSLVTQFPDRGVLGTPWGPPRTLLFWVVPPGADAIRARLVLHLKPRVWRDRAWRLLWDVGTRSRYVARQPRQEAGALL